MLSSSPRPDGLSQRLSRGVFDGGLQVPSSPTLAYQDGEISPSFDASFASSMRVGPLYLSYCDSRADLRIWRYDRSISSNERQQQPTPLPAHLRSRKCSAQSSPVVAMDISPAPEPVAGPSGSASHSRPIRAPAPRPPLFARPHSQPVVLAPAALSDEQTGPAGDNGHPFLKSLFKAQKSAPPEQTAFAPIGPLSLRRSASPDLAASAASFDAMSSGKHTGPSSSRPALQHFATVPPSQAERLRPPFAKTAVQYRASGDGFDVASVDSVHALGGLGRPSSTGARARTAVSSTSSNNKQQRQTAPAGQLVPPVLAPVKRHSDPALPSLLSQDSDSSPFRMQVDGESPRPTLRSPIALRPGSQLRSVSDSAASPSGSSKVGHLNLGPDSSPSSDAERSGASDRLADMFGCSPGDNLSPIPPSRKRVLELENSPTPASASPTASILGALGGPTRRVFEKSATTANLPLRVRRQRSAVGLNARAPLVSYDSFGAPATAAVESFAIFNNAKRQATQAHDGKPAPVPPMLRPSRRSNSVADPSFLCSSSAGSTADANSSGASVPMALSARDLNIPLESPRTFGPRSSLSNIDGTYLCGKSAAKKAAVGMSPEAGSPIAGFRKQEAKGKALPCHGVQEDGLMRITPQTVSVVRKTSRASLHDRS